MPKIELKSKEFLLLPLHESRQTSPPPIEVQERVCKAHVKRTVRHIRRILLLTSCFGIFPLVLCIMQYVPLRLIDSCPSLLDISTKWRVFELIDLKIRSIAWIEAMISLKSVTKCFIVFLDDSSSVFPYSCFTSL